MIRTLIVGGTGFLGVEIARAALAHGHQVSILTRGPTVPIPGVTAITADRFGPLYMPQDQDFDLVFDTCAYVPEAVTHLLRNVASARYVMISSISVHPRFDLPALSKDTPVTSATAADLAPYQAVPFADWANVQMNGEGYGPLKRACGPGRSRGCGGQSDPAARRAVGGRGRPQ